MARSHRIVEGEWVECPPGLECALPIHVELSVVEAQALPSAFIERLAEAFDPPTGTDEYGDRYWMNEAGELHRDYDLPAIISEDGVREWYQHGKPARFGGRPEFENDFGDKAWMDKPAQLPSLETVRESWSAQSTSWFGAETIPADSE